MFQHSTTYYPKPGDSPQLRALVLQRAQELRQGGVRVGVTASSWTADFPAVQLHQQFETLDDLEAGLDANRAPAFIAATDELIRQGVRRELCEVLALTAPSSEPARWGVRISLAPALGKAGDLRALMAERSKHLDAEGRRSTLTVQIAGPESGLLTRTFAYGRLGDLERLRARTAAREFEQDFMRREQALVSRPNTYEIIEVLLPIPMP